MKTLCSRTLFVALVGQVIAAFAFPGSAAAAESTTYPVYAAEAETFSLSTASLVTDWKASANRATAIRAGGAIWRWSTMPAGNRFVLRAKATTCGTAPRMVFKIGTTVMRNVGVSRTDWTDYGVAIGRPAGTQVLSVWFERDYVTTSGCTRLLKVDSIVLWSDVPVNQGIPGSVCQPSDNGVAYSVPPSAYSTTSLGRGPGYYEMAPPSDRSASEAPEGVMMLVHGGGWYISGPGATASMRGSAELWRAHGWSVLSVSSEKACNHWLEDVLWFYDEARTSSPDLPICISGHSAGGHLAMMVASNRADIRCVISYGGPTDLVGLAEQQAYDPATGGGQDETPRVLHELAIAAFGADALEANSPLNLVDTIDSSVLLAVAERDPVIPLQQVTDMAAELDAAHPDVRHEAMVLEHGTAGWVHALVSHTAADAAWSLGVSIAGG